MKHAEQWVAGAVGVGLIVAGALLWWNEREMRPVPLPAGPAEPVPIASAPLAGAASEPAIKYPIEAAAAASAASAPGDIGTVLGGVFEPKAMRTMFRLDDFARRFVATVDNLGRAHAPASLWPVNPAGGRLVVERGGDGEVLGADNGLRYTPYVLLLETVDLRRAAAAYVELYPQFQQAYRDLGYPKGYFNDRLVEVIDQLLATPEPEAAPAVHVPAVNGPIQPQRPWLFYQFDHAPYEALSAGQKLLLRTGPVNERRIKVRLREFRRLVAQGKVPARNP